MGGWGSGEWIRDSKKSTVEDCRAILDINRIARTTGVQPGSFGELSRSAWLQLKPWTVKYIVHEAGDERQFGVIYRCYGKSISYGIRLESTLVRAGGIRWWFNCPLTVGKHRCGRRSAKLYLHGRYFGCRNCHDLTYRSCQQTKQRN